MKTQYLVGIGGGRLSTGQRFTHHNIWTAEPGHELVSTSVAPLTLSLEFPPTPANGIEVVYINVVRQSDRQTVLRICKAVADVPIDPYLILVEFQP